MLTPKEANLIKGFRELQRQFIQERDGKDAMGVGEPYAEPVRAAYTMLAGLCHVAASFIAMQNPDAKP